MTVRRYHILSQCNHAVIHATDEESLFAVVCQVLVESGGYAMAWIGLPLPDKRFAVAAAYGEYTAAIEKAKPSWDTTQPSGSGPTGSAFRTRQPIFINDLTRHNPHLKQMPASHTGQGTMFKGVAALPLVAGSQTLGVMVVYTHTVNGFDTDEEGFLTTLAADVAFGITVLRERQVSQQTEAHFTQALQQKEAELRQIIDALPHGLFIRNNQGDLLLVNQVFADNYAMQAEEMVGLNYRTIHPSLAEVERFLADDQILLSEGKRRVAPVIEFTTPNGERRVHQVIKVPVYMATHDEYAVLGVAVDITTLKRLEESLTESRDMLEAVFANAPIGVAMLYEETLVWANSSLCQMIDYPRENISELPLAAFFAMPTDYETTHHILARPLSLPQRYHEQEIQWQRQSSETFWCRLRLTRLDNRTSVMMAMDVSETRATIEALQESLVRYHSLFDGSPNGIAILDQHSVIHEVNQGLATMFGYERHDLLKRPLAELSAAPQLTSESFVQKITQSLAGEPQRIECLFQHQDGRRFYTEVYLNALDLEDKPLVQVIIHDIDERKRAEERFVKIFRTSPDSISISSLHSGVYYEVNDAFLNLTGFSREEVIGQCVGDIGLWKNLDDRRRLVEQLLAQGAVQSLEIPYRNKAGREGVVLMSAEVIDFGGDEPFILALTKDITERIETEQALRERDRLAAELAKEREVGELKSRFVTMASHEFRTPLATILAAATNLQRYFDRMDNTQREKQFHKISSTIFVLTKMLDDILMVGHSDSGMLQLSLGVGDVGAACRTILEELQTSNDEHLRLVVTESGLPNTPVFFDEKLLRHILVNLVTNALKYSTHEVLVDLTYQGGMLKLWVSDRGIGIPAAEQAAIFEAFHRGSNVGTRLGTGLGLTVTKLAVDLYGGSIDLTSQEGVGTTFTVRLPMPSAV